MAYLDGPAPTPQEELLKMGGEVRNALTALKESTEAKNADTLKRVEGFFSKYEDENQKFAREYALHQKAQAEFQEKIEKEQAEIAELKKGSAEYEKRVKDLELLVSTKGKSSDPEADKRDTSEYKGFFTWLTTDRTGQGLCREIATKQWDGHLDLKTLRTDSETAGGYLIPQVMDNQIRKNIIEISPIRAHARVRTSPAKTMDVPRRLSIPIAQYEGEAEAAPTDQSVYGSEQVTLYRQTVLIPATLDMMVSSAFDLEKEIAADVGESFAQGEGNNFVKGSGRKSPQGLTQDSRVVGYTTATSATVVWADFASMSGKLKRGMQPWWYFNRRTLAFLQSLQSSINVPIWQPVAGGQPASIWGYPYDAGVIDLDDAGTTSGNKPVIFADLMRGYEIYDMIGINVVRDDLTQASKAITQWIFRRYNTGRVIIPEAICVMTIQ